MNQKIPTVAKYMSSMPHTIVAKARAIDGLKLMEKYKIRHLPVLDGNKLVGIVSDRNLRLVKALANPEEVLIEKVMFKDPYIVRPTARLDEIAATMHKKKYGSVIVQQEDGTVSGIFTTVDAMRVLSQLLKEMAAGPTTTENLFKIFDR